MDDRVDDAHEETAEHPSRRLVVLRGEEVFLKHRPDAFLPKSVREELLIGAPVAGRYNSMKFRNRRLGRSLLLVAQVLSKVLFCDSAGGRVRITLICGFDLPCTFNNS